MLVQSASRPPRPRPLVGAAAIVVTVAAGSAVDVLLRGHAFVENLIAAVVLGAFVIGIAWIDRGGWPKGFPFLSNFQLNIVDISRDV